MNLGIKDLLKIANNPNPLNFIGEKMKESGIISMVIFIDENNDTQTKEYSANIINAYQVATEINNDLKAQIEYLTVSLEALSSSLEEPKKLNK